MRSVSQEHLVKVNLYDNMSNMFIEMTLIPLKGYRVHIISRVFIATTVHILGLQYFA